MYTNTLNKNDLMDIGEIIKNCYYIAIEIDFKNKTFSIPNSKNNNLKKVSFEPNLKNETIAEYKKALAKYLIFKLEAINLTGISEYEQHIINKIIDLKTQKYFDGFENLLILYQRDKIEIQLCSDIYDYLEKEKSFRVKHVHQIQSEDIPQTIYYRGNKLNFDLSSSLYRDEDLIKNEHIINNRIIQSMPNDFQKCESYFDKLTILKHFNCPSRLLDITKNPLIAAFFALDEYNHPNKKSNFGIINLCFPTNFDIIKNSTTSDSVSLLSALSTIPKNNKKYIQINKIKESASQINKQIDLVFSKIKYLKVKDIIFAKYQYEQNEKKNAILNDIYLELKKTEKLIETSNQVQKRFKTQVKNLNKYYEYFDLMSKNQKQININNVEITKYLKNFNDTTNFLFKLEIDKAQLETKFPFLKLYTLMNSFITEIGNIKNILNFNNKKETKFKNNQICDIKNKSKEITKIIYETPKDPVLWIDELQEYKQLLKSFLNALDTDKTLYKFFFEKELQHQALVFNPESISLFTPSDDDIDTFYIVNPSLNNERILNQQGLFILIGASKNSDGFYINPNLEYLSLFKNNQSNKRVAFIINNINNIFYNELNHTYGINKGFIYPELENKVTQIKNDVMHEFKI